MDGLGKKIESKNSKLIKSRFNIRPHSWQHNAAVCDSDPVLRVDDAHSSSVVLTPISEVSSADLSVSSPHFQNPEGLLEPTGASLTSETAAQQDNPTGDTPAEKDPKKAKQHLHCPICKVTVNSTIQMDAHNSGTKHKLTMEGQSVLPRRRGKTLSSRPSCKSKRLASKGSVGVASKSFYCEVCEIHVNSETQLSQHMNSRRHKDRLAGKPPKPKFNPHAKSQPTSAASVSTVTLTGIHMLIIMCSSGCQMEQLCGRRSVCSEESYQPMQSLLSVLTD
ncbi:hypothetical protein cypCar_00036031 [Cyprinus carpio]|nr:hypothetical protein cypCar_00036031 [Cyprinus carpio]